MNKGLQYLYQKERSKGLPARIALSYAWSVYGPVLGCCDSALDCDLWCSSAWRLLRWTQVSLTTLAFHSGDMSRWKSHTWLLIQRMSNQASSAQYLGGLIPNRKRPSLLVHCQNTRLDGTVSMVHQMTCSALAKRNFGKGAGRCNAELRNGQCPNASNHVTNKYTATIRAYRNELKKAFSRR